MITVFPEKGQERDLTALQRDSTGLLFCLLRGFFYLCDKGIRYAGRIPANGCFTEKTIDEMFELFLEGGPGAMSLLTVELICLFFAAWKAPSWVREIGLLALVTGLFWQLLGLYHALGVIIQVGEMPSFTLLMKGLRVSFIPVMYGMIVYVVSLLIRIVQKPRI